MIARKKLIVNFDGLCEPANPAGIPCYGFLIKNETDLVLHREYGLVNSVKPFSPEANSNAAEYGSAVRAMQWLVENGCVNYDHNYQIIVRGDSQLIMRKLKSEGFRSKAARITPLCESAKVLRSKFAPSAIRFEWVKRDDNWEADDLAKKAYYWALRRYPYLQMKVRKHWATMLWLEQTIHREH